MSYYYAEKLDLFADLATSVRENESLSYCDPSDPDNIQAAQEYFDKELTFLSKRDKQALKDVWQGAVQDCLSTKLLFNAIKVLKDKYDQTSTKSNYSVSFYH